MLVTRSQLYAAQAFTCVSAVAHKNEKEKYATFARRLPGLIHTCGLAQAIAFARSKTNDYGKNIDDLKMVMNAPQLETEAAAAENLKYLRLSREAIQAASWLKRYAEALIGNGNLKE